MHMELVNCTEEYWEFVRTLRNDERVINGFVEFEYITPEMQTRYMERYSTMYRVVLVDGVAAGYFGVLWGDIRVCTHPDFQGRGIGKFMIEECTKIWPNSVARVKLENIPSNKLFQSVGFIEVDRDDKFIYYKKDDKS
jgi:ribosomal protein S18 acetylase RimI-like enzyme